MKRTLYILIALIVLTMGVWITVRGTHKETETPGIQMRGLTVENIPGLLEGAVIRMPFGDITVDVPLASYVSGGVTLLGGTAKQDESTVTVFVPEAEKDLPKGDWVLIDGDDVFVPLYANFGGTGQFFMIALFTYDDKTDSLVFDDINFIDDRIIYQGMRSSADVIHISYLTRAEGQAMAEVPTLAAVRVIKESGKHIIVVE